MTPLMFLCVVVSLTCLNLYARDVVHALDDIERSLRRIERVLDREAGE